MAQKKALPKTSSRPRNKAEEQFLKRIGRKVHKDLYDLNKPVEWLAFEAGVSRATIRRVFDAEWNIGILTLDRIAKGLGYKDIVEFLSAL